MKESFCANCSIPLGPNTSKLKEIEVNLWLKNPNTGYYGLEVEIKSISVAAALSCILNFPIVDPNLENKTFVCLSCSYKLRDLFKCYKTLLHFNKAGSFVAEKIQEGKRRWNANNCKVDKAGSHKDSNGVTSSPLKVIAVKTESNEIYGDDCGLFNYLENEGHQEESNLEALDHDLSDIDDTEMDCSPSPSLENELSDENDASPDDPVVQDTQVKSPVVPDSPAKSSTLENVLTSSTPEMPPETTPMMKQHSPLKNLKVQDLPFSIKPLPSAYNSPTIATSEAPVQRLARFSKKLPTFEEFLPRVIQEPPKPDYTFQQKPSRVQRTSKKYKQEIDPMSLPSFNTVYNFPTEAQYSRYRLTSFSLPIKCRCLKICDSFEDYKVHAYYHLLRKVYKCPEPHCYKFFSQFVHFENHCSKVHSRRPLAPKERVHLDLDSHLLPPAVSKQDKAALWCLLHPKTIKRIAVPEGPPYRCGKCTATKVEFQTKEIYLKHVGKKRSHQTTSYKCNECGEKDFEGKIFYIRHCEQVHQFKPPEAHNNVRVYTGNEVKRFKVGESPPYNCSVEMCEKTFDNSPSLVFHIQGHFRKRPRQVAEHVRISGNFERPVKCDQCFKTYRTSSSMHHHKKIAHTEEGRKKHNEYYRMRSRRLKQAVNQPSKSVESSRFGTENEAFDEQQGEDEEREEEEEEAEEMQM